MVLAVIASAKPKLAGASCRSRGNDKHVSHRSLDGAQNAPPTRFTSRSRRLAKNPIRANPLALRDQGQCTPVICTKPSVLDTESDPCEHANCYERDVPPVLSSVRM